MPSNLMPVSEARSRLLDAFERLPVESVALAQVLGRILAEDVHAPFEMPAFTNSSMDGFAVRSADVSSATIEQPVYLPVVDDVPAGRPTLRVLQPGQAMRIMTGAALPAGADAVVPVEETDFRRPAAGAALPEQVGVLQAVPAGNALRQRGQDLSAGATILPAGRLLRPQEIGLLASLGFGHLPVRMQPAVGLLSTGDELMLPGQTLAPGQIYDSNTSMLSALVVENGGQVASQISAADRPEAIRAALDAAVDRGVQLLLSSAGVSVGAFDYVRQVVQSAGKMDFWRVNMRPGKPVAFGHYRNVPFIGLPGNPVSAFVGFYVFVRPALWKLGGRPDAGTRLLVRLVEPVQSDGRESYLRATVFRQGNEWLALPLKDQGSANLYVLTQANAFIIVPSEVKSLPSGAQVEAWLLGAADGFSQSALQQKI